MRTGSWIIVAAVALTLALPAAGQTCPYAVQFSSYGQNCGFAPPTLEGDFDGSLGCSVQLAFDVPATCCNTYLVGQFLVVGLQHVEHVFPSGCSLLASPDIIVSLPAQPGLSLIKAELPHNAALVGLSIYVQGVVDHFTTIGLSHDFAFTAGLRMEFV